MHKLSLKDRDIKDEETKILSYNTHSRSLLLREKQLSLLLQSNQLSQEPFACEKPKLQENGIPDPRIFVAQPHNY